MAMDPRQVFAAFLTLSMFAMLANMIKRDHFDSLQMRIPISSVEFDSIELTKQDIVKLSGVNKGLWDENSEMLRPCWNNDSLNGSQQSKGFIIFSLTDGPEYHISQIADAVVVARYLGATLMLPDIRGSKHGHRRNFGDIYDVKRFVRSLDGIIPVAEDPPADISSGSLTVVRVPNRVSEDYIASNVEPLFRRNGNIRLATYFPSLTMTRVDKIGYLDLYSCLAMFGTLQLQSAVQEVVDSMLERLRALSQKSNGRFIAVDLRIEMLKNECWKNGATRRKSCYTALEIGEFLKKIGFHMDTTIYLTHSGWHGSFDALRDIYPKTYTKEDIMPVDKKAKLLSSESREFEKVIDFHICSQSDVFVPAFSGLFYANVAGKRIAYGKTKILVPSQITSAYATDYISPYISKRSHLAYSCLC